MHLNDGNFVTIQAFMVRPVEDGGLGLKGNEALVYAIIYGFSQNGESWFEGSQSYLAEWCGSTTRGIRKNLESLINKGFIEKRDGGVNGRMVVDYRVSQSSALRNKVPGSPEQSSYHNIVDSITPSDIDTNVSISSPPKGSRSFVKPTLDEVRAYCLERKNGIDPEAFIDHYDSNGWRVGKSPMKDWRAAIRNWERQRKERGETPPTERRMRGFGE